MVTGGFGGVGSAPVHMVKHRGVGAIAIGGATKMAAVGALAVGQVVSGEATDLQSEVRGPTRARGARLEQARYDACDA